MTQGQDDLGGNRNATPPNATPNRKPYAPENTREDGSYRVGKKRPPEHTRYRKGDERSRGRRPKGQPNFDTEFEAEGRRLITIREGEKKRHVSKNRGTIIRTYDNALTKGDPRAASLVFHHALRVDEKKFRSGSRLPQSTMRSSMPG